MLRKVIAVRQESVQVKFKFGSSTRTRLANKFEYDLECGHTVKRKANTGIDIMLNRKYLKCEWCEI
jgi:hypothetical protein